MERMDVQRTDGVIEFDCQHCQATLAVADQAGGKAGRCPRCGRPVSVPDSDAYDKMLTDEIRARAQDPAAEPPAAKEPEPLPDQAELDQALEALRVVSENVEFTGPASEAPPPQPEPPAAAPEPAAPATPPAVTVTDAMVIEPPKPKAPPKPKPGSRPKPTPAEPPAEPPEERPVEAAATAALQVAAEAPAAAPSHRPVGARHPRATRRRVRSVNKPLAIAVVLVTMVVLGLGLALTFRYLNRRVKVGLGVGERLRTVADLNEQEKQTVIIQVTLMNALEALHRGAQPYPSGDGGHGSDQTLRAGIEDDPAAADWLKRLPDQYRPDDTKQILDSFERPMRYDRRGAENGGPLLVSAGQDGKFDTEDDIRSDVFTGLALPAEIVWEQADKTVRLGDLEVSIADVAVETQRLSPETLLLIRLRLTHAGKKGELRYRSWGLAETAAATHLATLTEANGQKLRMRKFTPTARLKDQIPSAMLAPGETIDDVIVFEEPPEDVKLLRLSLPGAAYGAKGAIRFEIPGPIERRTADE